jgi:hypothetical protein
MAGLACGSGRNTRRIALVLAAKLPKPKQYDGKEALMATQAMPAERDARFARLRQAMEQQQLDALLVAGKGHWWTGRGYLRYLTDFHLWGHDGLLLLPLADDEMRNIDEQ